MSVYSCEPCKKTFNGIKPYESHLASEKHQRKVSGPISIIQDFVNCSVSSTDWEQEPSIIFAGNVYKCTLCKTFLNSVDQVKSHINGGKHLKAKVSVGFTNSNVLASHNQSIDQGGCTSLPSASSEDSRFHFSGHIDEIKKLVENIKVFNPNDEIVFN
ncbi:Zinc finger protein 346 like protein [Argiope bruennichi]|uniref:Zinc finger protein 346 like protein n=1 Tax=Argiope bruennichi TaxID=94029 RepID=A0A8T0EBU8_ARGBR|nr:Zinc finger protein 346 like protein [Argiope bruennichi]